MREIIRIRILEREAREIRWTDTVSGTSGRGVGPEWLDVGDEALVEVDVVNGRTTITRVVEPGGPVPEPEAEESPVLVNGVPLEPDEIDDPLAPIEVGQIRVASMPFSTHRSAERDRGRTEKQRPVVIVAVDGPSVGVRAIYGTNSARRRTGLSVRLRDRAGANLRKRSVVDLEMIWLARDDVGPLIGSLADVDRTRILEP